MLNDGELAQIEMTVHKALEKCPALKVLKNHEKRIRRVEFAMIALLIIVSGLNGYSVFSS